MDMTIGNNVKALREMRPWTQEELATVAGTSVRTIQRVERGEPASVETLRALAQALDVTVDVLRTSAEQWARAAENLKKMEERYRIVRLERIERASALSAMVAGADASLIEHVDLVNDTEEDAVAEFEGCVRDDIDVWSDLPAESRRESEKHLQTIIERLKAAGLVVAAGKDTRRLKLRGSDAEPMIFHTLYVMISRAKDPKLVIGIEKNAPVQFA